MRWGMVAVGGVAGTLARWGVEELLPGDLPSFPWGTFVANVTGAFALGLIGVRLLERSVGSVHIRTFLTIGVLGSYTTFSKMALDGVRLLDTDHAATAIMYWGATLVIGQLAGLTGMWTARAEAH